MRAERADGRVPSQAPAIEVPAGKPPVWKMVRFFESTSVTASFPAFCVCRQCLRRNPPVLACLQPASAGFGHEPCGLYRLGHPP